MTKHEELDPLLPTGLEIALAVGGLLILIALVALVAWRRVRQRGSTST